MSFRCGMQSISFLQFYLWQAERLPATGKTHILLALRAGNRVVYCILYKVYTTFQSFRCGMQERGS